MTAQPHPQVRLRRALDQGSVFLAEVAAGELDQVSLKDALDLVVLYARAGDLKFERASARWLSRLVEERSLTTQEVALVATALPELRGRASTDASRLLAAIADAG